jgi:hypothetical protein
LIVDGLFVAGQQFQFPSSLKKSERFAVPNKIIGHLSRECGGKVHNRHVVDVTLGSWKSEFVVERKSERPPAEAAGLTLRVEMLGQENRSLSDAKPFRPQSQEARGLFTDLDELIAFVGLGRIKGDGPAFSAGLASVAVRDWSDDFTFIVGDYRYRCPSSFAQFLSPRVTELHSVDDTISEIKIGVEDPDELFSVVLEAARSGGITVDSPHRLTFVAICAALWNSKLYESICGHLGSGVTMENGINRLRFRSATRCDISRELEFIASHFYNSLCRPDDLKALPLLMISEIIGHGSLSVDSGTASMALSEDALKRPSTHLAFWNLLDWNIAR